MTPHPDESLLAAVIDLGKDLELRSLLRRLVETAVHLTGAQYGALGILDGDGGFEDIIIEGIDPETAARIGGGPHGKGVLGLLVSDPRTLRLARIGDHPSSVGFPPHHPPMTSFLGTPVVIRGQVFGNLYLAEKMEATEFTDADESIVEALAAAAGSAISHARALAHAQARERWRRAADDATELLTEHPVSRVWPQVTDRLREAIGAPHVEHIPPHSMHARLGHLSEHLTAKPRATFLSQEEIAPLVDGAAQGLIVPVVVDRSSVSAFLFAWTALRFDISPQALTAFGQSLTDRLTISTLLAQRHAEAERVAILEDRDRIAQDLHDHVIQRLFAAGMRVQSAMTLVEDDTATEKLSSVLTDLDDTVKDVRRAIFELHEGNAALGLSHSLDQLAESSVDALGFRPIIALAGDYWTMPDPLVADILAVVRETLSNAARHAHATSVRVVVDVSDGITVKTTDDGVGIPETLERRSGLAHLVARAERWGGGCDIRRRRSGGTAIVWHVPRQRSVG